MSTNKKAESIAYGGMEPGSSNARASRRVETPSPVADTVNTPDVNAEEPMSDKHEAAANLAEGTTHIETPVTPKPTKARAPKATKASKKKAGK